MLTQCLRFVQGEVAYRLVNMLLDTHFPFLFQSSPVFIALCFTLYIVLQMNGVVYWLDPVYKKSRGDGKFSNENSFDERLILINVQQYVCKHSLIDLCELETFFHSFMKQLFIECLLHVPSRLRAEQVLPLFGR